jgi:hypothetical protein
MALDPAERKEVLSCFQSWMEIQDRRKELTEENKEIVASTASILGEKTKMVNKLFKVLQNKTENGEDELEDLYNLLNDVEGQ